MRSFSTLFKRTRTCVMAWSRHRMGRQSSFKLSRLSKEYVSLQRSTLEDQLRLCSKFTLKVVSLDWIRVSAPKLAIYLPSKPQWSWKKVSKHPNTLPHLGLSSRTLVPRTVWCLTLNLRGSLWHTSSKPSWLRRVRKASKLTWFRAMVTCGRARTPWTLILRTIGSDF